VEKERVKEVEIKKNAATADITKLDERKGQLRKKIPLL
jgi:hypothetical protein